MEISIGLVISKEPRHQIYACINALEESLKIAQSYISNFEIIVVVSSIGDKYFKANINNVKVLFSNSNNIAKNRNIILSEAKYEQIYFTDPDCLAQKETLVSLLKVVKKYEKKNIFAVAGPNLVRSRCKQLESFFEFLQNSVFLHMGSAQVAKSKIEYLDWHSPTCNILYLRDSISSFRFDENFALVGEDLDFNFRVSHKTGRKILIIPDAKVFHIQSGQKKDILKKFFAYGKAQTMLFRANFYAAKNKRLWPLIIGIFSLISLTIFSRTFLGEILIIFPLVYITLFLGEILRQRKLKKIFQYLMIHFSLTVSYMLGQLRGLIVT